MANYLESVRVQWSESDEQFFRIARDLFAPAFLSGASALLASYDPEPAPVAAPTSASSSALAEPSPSSIAA